MKTLIFNNVKLNIMKVDNGKLYVGIHEVKEALGFNLNLSNKSQCHRVRIGKRTYVAIVDLLVRLKKVNIGVYKKIANELIVSIQNNIEHIILDDFQPVNNSSLVVEMLGYTPDLQTIIADRAGICYDNETDDPDKLIRRLKLNKHLATFRFAHVTFQVSNFSRSCSMQMLRHAFLDYLQRSQRYVNEFQFDYVIPPSIANHSAAIIRFKQAMKEDQDHYDFLVKECKIRAEDARYVLPNACHTKMNIVGNIQAWYDFLYGDAGRLQKAAQWEIRAIAVEIEKHLISIAPDIFGKVDDKVQTT